MTHLLALPMYDIDRPTSVALSQAIVTLLAQHGTTDLARRSAGPLAGRSAAAEPDLRLSAGDAATRGAAGRHVSLQRARLQRPRLS